MGLMITMTRLAASVMALIGSTLVFIGEPIVTAQSAAPAPVTVSTAAIDREVWTAIVESVRNDDIAQMGNTYANHAVLVGMSLRLLKVSGGSVDDYAISRSS